MGQKHSCNAMKSCVRGKNPHIQGNQSGRAMILAVWCKNIRASHVFMSNKQTVREGVGRGIAEHGECLEERRTCWLAVSGACCRTVYECLWYSHGVRLQPTIQVWRQCGNHVWTSRSRERLLSVFEADSIGCTTMPRCAKCSGTLTQGKGLCIGVRAQCRSIICESQI